METKKTAFFYVSCLTNKNESTKGRYREASYQPFAKLSKRAISKAC